MKTTKKVRGGNWLYTTEERESEAKEEEQERERERERERETDLQVFQSSSSFAILFPYFSSIFFFFFFNYNFCREKLPFAHSHRNSTCLSSSKVELIASHPIKTRHVYFSTWLHSISSTSVCS